MAAVADLEKGLTVQTLLPPIQTWDLMTLQFPQTTILPQPTTTQPISWTCRKRPPRRGESSLVPSASQLTPLTRQVGFLVAATHCSNTEEEGRRLRRRRAVRGAKELAKGPGPTCLLISPVATIRPLLRQKMRPKVPSPCQTTLHVSTPSVKMTRLNFFLRDKGPKTPHIG